jgi:hypothetical protein
MGRVIQFPVLTVEEREAIDFNDFSIEDIHCLIDMNYCTSDDVAWFYGDLSWDE